MTVFLNLSWNQNGFLQSSQNSIHLLLLITQICSWKCLHDRTLLLRRHGCANTTMKSWHKLQSSHLSERNEMVQVMLDLLLQFMEILKESSFHVELHQDTLILMQEQWSLQQLMKQYETQFVLVLISIKWLDLTTSVGQIRSNQKRLQMANSNLLNSFVPIEN